MKMAAIYARVSSEQQREKHTIASQTAALIEFAKTHELEVPREWVFEDEGYSGATLERPGLERVRDLAAEGQIQVVLVYSPDRLSRKYAYQILLTEELARHGVETLFINAPQSATAEDQLVVQFQGMIAEYERAQIMERYRCGKRHRAKSGEVSVMSGAPYGYRYIRKTEDAPASYRVIEAEARVVQRIYKMYTVEGLSIGAITRRLKTSAHKLHYYKCIGADGWRKLGGPVCDNGRFVRQDLLDQVVWTEVIRLLEDSTLIQHELDRRLAAARAADPTKKRDQGLQKEIIRVGKSVERILSAYQEGLLSLEQLRERMPPLRQREQALREEARAIADQTNDSAMFLRFAETLTDFLTRLRNSANTLDVIERQRIVRLVVKDVLIGDDTLVIRHCIPIVAPSPSSGAPPAAGNAEGTPKSQDYLLRKGSERTPLRGALRAHLH